MAAAPPFEQFLHRPRGLVIGGIDRPAASGRWFEVTNPAASVPAIQSGRLPGDHWDPAQFPDPDRLDRGGLTQRG